jgi:APA family basic amino acid/polyamine antiporter
MIIIAMIGLWIPVLINLRGVGSMGAFQTVTTVLKFLPLIFMGTVGLYFALTLNNWPSWNPSGEGMLGSVSTSLTLATFAYVGVETAAIAAAKVKNPEENVPKATLLGTIATAAVYILITIAIFGIVPNGTLQDSGAPFSDAFNEIFGGSWGGKLVAAFAVISGIGALNGWTMICGEGPQAAAKNKLFPAVFARENKNGVPAFGIISSPVLASIAMGLALGTSGGIDAFSKIIQFSGVTVGIPYFFSVLVQLYWLLTEGRRLNIKSFGRDVAISVVALVFTFWMIAGSGRLANFLGMLVLLLGFVMMMFLFVETGRFGAKQLDPEDEPLIEENVL